MRGKDLKRSRLNPIGGITPAYAGKRDSKPNFDFSTKDHPRLCGEKFLIVLKSQLPHGSPPPMRGKVQKALQGVNSKRITPAYAGKRRFSLLFIRNS